MINTRLHSIRFNTTLPYNCIYYVTGRKDNSKIYAPSQHDNKKIIGLQSFPFFYLKIQGENLTESMLSREKCLDSANAPTLTKDILSTLKEIFPETDYGCYVVRLLPYSNQSNDNPIDTLFVCELSLPSNPWDITEFAIEAARQNFERMTGSPAKHFRRTAFRVDEDEEIRLRLSNFGMDSTFFGDRRLIQFHYERSSSPKKATPKSSLSTEDKKRIAQQQKQIMQECRKRLEQFFATDANHSDFDKFSEVIRSAYGDLNNIGKIATKCTIKILPKEDGNDDIFVCPEGQEPIVCDFSRGWAAKTLYIFFLRHLEGVPLEELGQHIDELAAIYHRLSGCDDTNGLHLKRAQAIVTVSNKSQKGSRAENMNSIRSWFDKRFVSKLAGDYSIKPIDDTPDEKTCLYGVNIPYDMIDLGPFHRTR